MVRNNHTTTTTQGYTIMSQALDYMLQLIEDGYDYSEALYKASDMYKVSHDALQEAYDSI